VIRWKTVAFIAVVEATILFFLAKPLDTEFFDMMFFGGVVFIVLSWLFGKRGGYLSRNMKMGIGGSTGYLINDDENQEEESSSSINPLMLASVIVTIIGLVSSLIKYREYF
jgi:hypothetical protein